MYPVLVNILSPRATVTIQDRYESLFMGLQSRQEYRVINLWEVEAAVVFQQPLPTLVPFVPVLRGGGDERMVQRAVQTLRQDARLNELEPLLAFFASFVLESRIVQQIMRWDMTVLRESPWYKSILEEGTAIDLDRGVQQGFEQGREQGLLQALLHILRARFGEASPDVRAALAPLNAAQLTRLTDVALATSSLADFLAQVPVTGSSESVEDHP